MLTDRLLFGQTGRADGIRGYSRYDGVLTLHHVSASARFAHPVFTAEEADTNPLTDFPFGHSAAQCLNAANYFMPRERAAVSNLDRYP